MNEPDKKDILNLQECLALERTTLANERTFLSYVRTAIMVFITGASVFKLFPDTLVIFALGWVAVVISVILFFAGLHKYIRRFKSFTTLKSNCFTK